MAPQKFILAHKRSPGDIVCLTALVRDLHLNYPGRFEIDVDTRAADLWQNNPHLVPLRLAANRGGARYLKLEYGKGLSEQRHETIHFAAYFHRVFHKHTGISVPMRQPYGDLHLSQIEKAKSLVAGRYWVVLSGGKSDVTVKVWETAKFQQVVDGLRQTGLGVVQAGGNDRGHWHPPLSGVLNLVGQTNLRDMLQLIYHADGVICGVTFAMHAAAALQKPCVVLGGGREAWWWEAYCRQNAGLGGIELAKTMPVPHRYLHTIGLLDCCRYAGCWMNKVASLNGDKKICKQPVVRPGQTVPRCMDLITANHVLEAAMSYYTDKTLPPIVAADLAALPPAPASALPPLATTVVRNGAIALADGARFNKQKPGPAATHPGRMAPIDAVAAFDHPDVGGKFTIMALFYGGEEFFDLHKRCLEGILTTVPEGRGDIRVGSNQLNAKSLAMINEYVEAGKITKHYRHLENAYKYPVMHEMLYDPALPIKTKWIVWFDDDSIVVDPRWLSVLSQAIATSHRRENAHMYGAVFTWPASPSARRTLASRPWYKGKPWRMHNGRPAPNGNRVKFCTGGWWAVTYEAMVASSAPDLGTGLTHNGGDWQIGEQLYQNGFNIKGLNDKRQIVNYSSVKRRGVEMPLPGAAPIPPAASVPAVPAAVLPPPPPPAPPPPAPPPPLVVVPPRNYALLDL